MSEEKPKGELVVYSTTDQQVEVQLKIAHDTAWLTQLEMAELFQTTKQNVSLHLSNIFEEGELEQRTTVKDYLIVQKEVNRELRCKGILDNWGFKKNNISLKNENPTA